MKPSLKTYLYLTAAVLAASCCKDNNILPPVETAPIEISEQRIETGSDARYYSVDVQVNTQDYALRDINVSTQTEWISLEADTVSNQGRLTFHIDSNEGARSRDGIINLSIKGSSDQQVAQLTVHQHSLSEDGTNSLAGDSLSRKARVGYGYNMLIDYMNPACVTEPILDYELLVQAEQNWGTIIAEEGRAQQDFQFHCSYSIEEMSSWMSKQTSTEVDFLFCNKSVEKFKSVKEYDLSQQTFGYSSLSKVVATRYVDEGKIQSIIREGQDLFTPQFRELYDQVNDKPTAQNVKKLVSKYGTHMVIYTDLGGRLDYTVNFISNESSTETVEKYLKVKNGVVKEDNQSFQSAKNICSSGGDLYFEIFGGTDQACRSLREHASTKDRYGQVDPGMLGEWLNSIRNDDPQSVSMVRCIMQPIWQLFSNQKARVEIINYILALSFSEAGSVGNRLQELGLDNYYQIDINEQMTQFGTSDKSTLAKIIYYDGLPKVEVCNEYVPELRGDRRITVFYPIYRGITNIRRGIFLGDGENAPSSLTFDDEGGCYVQPLEGYQPGDRLTTLYYIDGAFYPTSIGINIPKYMMTVADEWLNLYDHNGVDGNGNYPIVKIGPGFWSRTYINGTLGFIDQNGSSVERFYNVKGSSILFTEVFHEVASSLKNHLNFTVNDQNHWYLPTSDEMYGLLKYVGNNPKALFKNQMSGFNAEFFGYVVRKDVLTGEVPKKVELKYVDELCVIPFRDDGSYGTALMIKPDYTWKEAQVTKTHRNKYPVRPYRNKKFIHKNRQ